MPTLRPPKGKSDLATARLLTLMFYGRQIPDELLEEELIRRGPEARSIAAARDDATVAEAPAADPHDAETWSELVAAVDAACVAAGTPNERSCARRAARALTAWLEIPGEIPDRGAFFVRAYRVFARNWQALTSDQRDEVAGFLETERIGERLLPVVAECVRTACPDLIAHIVHESDFAPDETMPASLASSLLEVLETSSSWASQWLAVWALDRFGATIPREPLLVALRKPHSTLRAHALRALVRRSMPIPADDLVAQLEDLLTSGWPTTDVEDVRLLETYGEDLLRALQACEHRDKALAPLRCLAAQCVDGASDRTEWGPWSVEWGWPIFTLARLFPTEASEFVDGCLAHPIERVRLMGVNACDDLPDAACRQLLLRASSDWSRRVRGFAETEYRRRFGGPIPGDDSTAEIARLAGLRNTSWLEAQTRELASFDATLMEGSRLQRLWSAPRSARTLAVTAYLLATCPQKDWADDVEESARRVVGRFGSAGARILRALADRYPTRCPIGSWVDAAATLEREARAKSQTAWGPLRKRWVRALRRGDVTAIERIVDQTRGRVRNTLARELIERFGHDDTTAHRVQCVLAWRVPSVARYLAVTTRDLTHGRFDRAVRYLPFTPANRRRLRRLASSPVRGGAAAVAIARWFLAARPHAADRKRHLATLSRHGTVEDCVYALEVLLPYSMAGRESVGIVRRVIEHAVDRHELEIVITRAFVRTCFTPGAIAQLVPIAREFGVARLLRATLEPIWRDRQKVERERERVRSMLPARHDDHALRV